MLYSIQKKLNSWQSILGIWNLEKVRDGPKKSGATQGASPELEEKAAKGWESWEAKSMCAHMHTHATKGNYRFPQIMRDITKK